MDKDKIKEFLNDVKSGKESLTFHKKTKKEVMKDIISMLEDLPLNKLMDVRDEIDNMLDDSMKIFGWEL